MLTDRIHKKGEYEMTKKQFTNLIRKCDSDIFKEIAIEKDGVLIPISKIGISQDRNRIFFHTKNNNHKTAIAMNNYNIDDIVMLKINRDYFDYSLMIIPKAGRGIDKSIKVHINMKDGYSLYAYTDDVIRNYKAVAEAVPNHLYKFKGETVVVKHSTNSAMYRTFSEEENGDVLPVTDSYIMHNFDYVIFYDGITPNIPCIKMYSKDNKNIYTCAMGVHLISDNVVYTADGEFILNAME